MTVPIPPSSAAFRSRVLVIAAASITTLDGFDAFSLSLMGPKISAELNLPTASLGAIFASAMGGMIVGALVGGALADRLGRLRTLLVAFAFFSIAALTMPLALNSAEIVCNRLIAGMGLGAAAPIAVALLGRSSERPQSEMVIAAVWSGIGFGGMLAAAFNYLIVTGHGWRSIFIAGGLLPLPVAVLAYTVFRESTPVSQSNKLKRSDLRDLFKKEYAITTIETGLMFFFGFVTTSVIVNWVPTVLTHRHSSPLMIFSTFTGLNVGAVVGAVLLGLVAARVRSGRTLALAWASAGACGLCAGIPTLDDIPVALLAIASTTVAAGSQALSVAFAYNLHRARGLEATSVGLMVSMGRLGQFASLSVSGILLRLGVSETGLFAFAGASACLAAVFARLVRCRKKR